MLETLRNIDGFFVFDVESVGLHGDGFAVGWVVVSLIGAELAPARCVAAPGLGRGTALGHEWVRDHLAPFPEPYETVYSLRDLRNEFWEAWQEAGNEHSLLLAADVPWPVEARFLAAVIDDYPARSGPYPLIDIASVRFARGLDPLGTEPRLSSEEPAHHPLMDARQSARLLLEALK